MAFICWKCYKKNKKNKDREESITWWHIAPQSYGPCEDCRKTTECADVYS